MSETIHDAVRDYYGRVLQSTKDLRTEACCPTNGLPAQFREILAQLEPEIVERFYGCGSPLPDDIEGCTVLDLGCGSGRDSYICSRLVGPKGRVIGLDMTAEQLDVGRRHLDTQMARFGFDRPNLSFVEGFIEDLQSAGIADASVDVVISNCVINLSPDKRRVFGEIFRVLKPGGELFFADVFTGRRVPADLARDPVLLGECLGGAMYAEDFRRMLRELGVLDHRVLTSRRIDLIDPDIEAKVGMIDFYSRTVRCFKLERLEDICEDYGQVATYRGTLPGAPHCYPLDDHHCFITGKPMRVCGNTAAMVGKTRLARHFDVAGKGDVHFGPFDCVPAEQASESTIGSCC